MNELRDRTGEEPPRCDEAPGRRELLDILHEIGPDCDFSLERLLDRVVGREASR